MTSSVSPRLRALIASTAAVVFAASLLLASPATAAGGGDPASAAAAPTRSAPEATDIVKTADLSLFRPGNIIADAVFFNAATMNAGQIDSFLRSKGPTCRAGFVCLKDYRQNTPNRSADAYCNGYAGAGNESSATIIDKVSKSCGINPQVLIVMLQKEQSLVTYPNPSPGRYNIAMGQGCPDGAKCDPAYSGFFYQVYYAARQMKIYAEGRWFTYYAPGRTWNILFNPEPKYNCGSAPVYIENTATAALYYYTPYQPNRAALNAGYGTGDICSAYGNRNFYQYFTDWFGSTQRITSVIVRGDGPEVYLLSGGYRFHIKTAEDLRAFSAKLGAVSQVPASYLKTIPLGSQISRYVHDAREGILYLIDPDGTRHRFGSEKQILDFGYAFNSYVNLAPALIDAFPRGEDVGSLFHVGVDTQIYSLDNGQKRYVPSVETWRYLSGGKLGYVASMDPSAAAKFPQGRVVLIPRSMVREVDKPAVYLATAGTTLIHTPSLELGAAFGTSTAVTVLPSGALTGYTPAATTLSPFVTCDAAPYVISSAGLQRISGNIPATRFTTTALTAADCAAFTPNNTPTAQPFFIRTDERGEVYRLLDGQLQYISSYSDLVTLSGGTIRLVAWKDATVGVLGVTKPMIPSGTVVQFAGDGRVFRWNGSQLSHITTYEALLRIGGGKVPTIATIPARLAPVMPVGAPTA